jgi:formate hydrogenlyase transcriptional activator
MNAVLVPELTGTTEESTAVWDIAIAIASHTDLSELFHVLAERLHKLLDFHYLSVVLHDPQRDLMWLHILDSSSTFSIREGMEFGVEESPAGWAWQHQKPVIIRDTDREKRFPRIVNLLRQEGISSLCSLPLTTPRRRLGALSFGRKMTNAFHEEELRIPQLVASQVAVAVENALNQRQTQDLQKQLTQERDRLKLLLAVNNAVVSSLALPQLFRAIPASVRSAMQCDATCLSLPEGDSLRIHGLDFPQGKGFMREEMVFPVEGSSAGRAFRSGKPVVFHTAPAKAADSEPMRLICDEGFESGCFIPIIRRQHTLGVLHLLDRRKNAFNNGDVEFLNQIAGQVAIALENALEYRQVSESRERLAEERVYLLDELQAENRVEDIVAESPAFQRILKQVETVAPTVSTVLIQGETGTGKELIARAIHNLSSRRDRTFVKVNCAAIPLGLLESELFGHEKGAFTGAIERRIGRFELANHGTLFLDEIGDIPLELQPKLLRVLQEQEFERLGSTRSMHVDVRLVAATNADLAKMVEERKFRADLYYRLNVFPIKVPPLRERREEIPALVKHFAARYARRLNKKVESVASDSMEALMRYDWPGNIRELQNFIERALILTSGAVLRVPVSELRLQKKNDSATPTTLANAEREHILQTLRESGWVLGGESGAAKRLGVPRTTLIYKMRRLGIARQPE